MPHDESTIILNSLQSAAKKNRSTLRERLRSRNCTCAGGGTYVGVAACCSRPWPLLSTCYRRGKPFHHPPPCSGGGRVFNNIVSIPRTASLHFSTRCNVTAREARSLQLSPAPAAALPRSTRSQLVRPAAAGCGMLGRRLGCAPRGACRSLGNRAAHCSASCENVTWLSSNLASLARDWTAVGPAPRRDGPELL